MIVTFPKEYRPRVEVFRVRDRQTGRRLYAFDLVGRDEQGPYRIDMEHAHSPEDFYRSVRDWWAQGFEVVMLDEVPA